MTCSNTHTKTALGIGQGRFSKAGEAIRTPDIHVGNVTLYH